MDDAIIRYFEENPTAAPTLGELASAIQTPRATLRAKLEAGVYPDLVYIYGPSHGRQGRPAKIVCRRETAAAIAAGKAGK